jgi:transcription initiation factor TFIID TATA-box-binding protein
MVEIVNMTYYVNMNCKLNLEIIAKNLNDVKYDKKRFSAAIKRIKDPKCTVLIFNNGKLIITGCKTEDQCIIASQKISKLIQNLGYNVNIAEKSIKNMVGSIDYGSKIDLSSLAKSIGSNASFEPELFPGLIFSSKKLNANDGDKQNCKITVFRSGKINITGTKTKEELNDAFSSIFYYLIEL